MEALDGGTAAAAVDALSGANPGIPAARIERDTLETVSRLIEAGIVGARPGPSDDPRHRTPMKVP